MDDLVALHVGANVDIPVAIELIPGMSVMSVLGDVLGVPQGVFAHPRRQLKNACPEHLMDVMFPIASAGTLHIPECLSMAEPLSEIGMPDQIEKIADTSVDAFLVELERDLGGEVPPAWRKVVDNPANFLVAYSGLVRSIWESFAPVWNRARTLLEREIQRVGVASVTGTMGALLANLSPRVAFSEGNMLLPKTAAGGNPIAVRKITLMPLVSGTRACVYRIDGEGHAHIGYPLARLAQLWQGAEVADGASADVLAAMLGELRADILRMGNQAVSMGELASLLYCTAGTVTYHCRQLEQAGLLSRERRGREVRILRTLRGDALVDALS